MHRTFLVKKTSKGLRGGRTQLLAFEHMSSRLQVFDPDRFQDVQNVGAGSHAMIFAAWDRDLERRVALKISLQDTLLDVLGSEHLRALDIDAGLRQYMDEIDDASSRRYSILREARLLAKIEHPNVISILDVGVLDGSVTMVLPLLRRGPLSDEAMAGSWREVLDTALAIGEGLAAIHDAGLIHRDLKPNNILFDERGRPRISDLGLACRLDDEAAMADWPGTRAYMAPETRAQHHRDPRDDLYAYCVVVFQMLHGHMPFATEAARVEGQLSRIDRENGPPSALLEVLARGLHPHMDGRYPNMPALLADLREAAAPARPRRWSWLAAGLAASVALATLASSATTVWTESCGDLDHELNWDTRTASELRGALASPASSSALDRWAGRWARARAQECALAKRGERSRPSPCLAREREHFEATVDALHDPSRRLGLDEAALIAELPAPERCLDDPSEELRETNGVLELRELAQEVELLVIGADPSEAELSLGVYMARALALGSRYDVAHALLWRGELRRRSGDHVEAQRDLVLAHERAAELDASELAASALLGLAELASDLDQPRAVEAYATAARAAFARECPERVAEVDIVHGLGLREGDAEDRERALGLLRGALDTRERQFRLHGGDRDRVAEAYEALARGLLYAGHYEEALAITQHGLSLAHERTRALQESKVIALIKLGHHDEAERVAEALINPLIEAADHAGAAAAFGSLSAAFRDAHELQAAKNLHVLMCREANATNIAYPGQDHSSQSAQSRVPSGNCAMLAQKLQRQRKSDPNSPTKRIDSWFQCSPDQTPHERENPATPT